MADQSVNIHIGYKVDEESAKRIIFPDNYTATIAVDYKTRGLDKVALIGNHTATQTLQLDASKYNQALSKVHVMPSEITTFLKAEDQTGQAFRKVFAEMSKIPGGAVTYLGLDTSRFMSSINGALKAVNMLPGQINCDATYSGNNAESGLKRIGNNAMQTTQALELLKKAMLESEAASAKLGGGLKSSVDSGDNLILYLRNALSQMKTLKSYLSSLGQDYKKDSLFRGFNKLFNEGFALRASSDAAARKAFEKKYESFAYNYARTEIKGFSRDDGELSDVKKLKAYMTAVANLGRMLNRLNNQMETMRAKSKGLFDLSSIPGYAKMSAMKGDIMSAISSKDYGTITQAYASLGELKEFQNAFDNFKTKYNLALREARIRGRMPLDNATRLGISQDQYKAQVEALRQRENAASAAEDRVKKLENELNNQRVKGKDVSGYEKTIADLKEYIRLMREAKTRSELESAKRGFSSTMTTSGISMSNDKRYYSAMEGIMRGVEKQAAKLKGIDASLAGNALKAEGDQIKRALNMLHAGMKKDMTIEDAKKRNDAINNARYNLEKLQGRVDGYRRSLSELNAESKRQGSETYLLQRARQTAESVKSAYNILSQKSSGKTRFSDETTFAKSVLDEALELSKSANSSKELASAKMEILKASKDLEIQLQKERAALAQYNAEQRKSEQLSKKTDKAVNRANAAISDAGNFAISAPKGYTISDNYYNTLRNYDSALSADRSSKTYYKDLAKAEQEYLKALAAEKREIKNFNREAAQKNREELNRQRNIAAVQKSAQKLKAAFFNDYNAMKKNGQDVSMFEGDVKKLTEMLRLIMQAKNATERMRAVQNLNNAINRTYTPKQYAQDEYKKSLYYANEYSRRLQEMGGLHRENTSLVSQLGQEIAMAYSVSQIRQFLSNIVEIGGQFEYQRKSIATILNDAGKANILFNQVKQLALNSPFSTIQLDQYVKELSAFGTPYEDLFQKMSKLADISAGTGTDMSRIILAYGHVQSAGYLEGMQRRQFTNANIPIISELQKYYQKQRGENYTSKDIYKMISDKQVTAQDVDNVLMAMAEPGGRFYKMQEEMANTTKGVWKNVGDAINHMYMDLENTHSGLLKWFGNILKSILGTIKDIALPLEVIGGIWAIIKITSAAILAGERSAIGVETQRMAIEARRLAIKNHFLVGSKAELAFGREMEKSYRRANTTWYQRLGFFTKLDAKSTEMYITSQNMEKLNAKNHVKQLVAQGQLSAAEAAKIKYKEKGLLLTKAETAALVEGKRISIAWASIWAGIKSTFYSMLPMLAIGAVIGTLTAWYQSAKEAKRAAQEMNTAFSESGRNIRESLGELSKVDFKAKGIADTVNGVNEMIRIFRDNIANSDTYLAKMLKHNNEGFLVNENEAAAKLQKTLGIVVDYYEKIGDNYLSGTMIDKADDTKKRAKGYAESMDDYNRYVNSQLSNPKGEKLMKGVLEELKKFDKSYANAVKGMSTGQALSYAPLFNFSKINTDKLPNKYYNFLLDLKKAAGATDDYVTKSQKVREDLRTLLTNNGMKRSKEMEMAIDKFLTQYYDQNEATKAYTSNLVKLSSATFDAEKGLMNFSQMLNDTKFDDKQEAPGVASDIKNQASLGIGGAGKVVLSGDDLTDVIKSARDLYSSNKEKITDLEGAKKAGATRKQDEERLNELNLKQQTLEKVAKDNGFSLEEDKKKRGSGEDKTDKALQKWKKEMDAVDKLQDIYTKYVKVYGDGVEEQLRNNAAWKKALEGMPDDFDKRKAYNEDYYDTYRNARIKKGITADKNADKEGRNDAIAKELSRVSSDALDKVIQQYSSWQEDISRNAEQRNKNVQTYTSILNSTGDRRLAEWIAFDGRGIDRAFSDLENAVQTAEDAINAKLQDLALQSGGALDLYTYGELKDKNSKELEALGGNGIYKTLIEEGNKAVSEAVNSEKQTLAGILKEMQSEREKLAAEEKTLDVKMEMLKRMGYEDEAKRLKSSYDSKVFRNSSDYQRFGSNAMSMSNKAFNAMLDKIEKDLLYQLGNGDINGNAYTEQLQKLFEKAKEYKKSGTGKGWFSRWFNGGLSLQELKKNAAYGNLSEASERVGKLKMEQLAQKQILSTTAQGTMAHEDAQEKLTKITLELADAEEALAEATAKFKTSISEDTKGAIEKTLKGINLYGEIGNTLQQAFTMISDTFYAAGNKSAGRKMEYASDIVGGMTSFVQPVTDMFQSLMKGDIGGIVKGAIMAPVSLITGPIKAFLELHDKKNQHKIEDLKDTFDDLGNDISNLERQLKNGFGSQSDVYGEKLKKQQEQLANLRDQLKLEEDKKKTDDDAVRQYKEQIEEMTDTIRNYATELANSLYGIDFKGWADQLSDALWNAFENGEDAALAWQKTVGDIVRSVSNSILKMWIQESFAERLYNKYLGVTFDEEGNISTTGKLVDANGNLIDLTKESAKNTLNQMYAEIASGSEQMIAYAESLYEQMSSLYPYSSNESSGSGLQKLGTSLTEQTGSVISGYINSINGHVSVMRTIADSQLSQLQAIATNTDKTARYMEALNENFERVMDGGSRSLRIQ